MPAYDYICDGCGWEGEFLTVAYEERDSQLCLRCSWPLQRVLCTAPTVGRHVTHQTKAIIYQGEKKVGYVDGHFGKSAKRKSK